MHVTRKNLTCVTLNGYKHATECVRPSFDRHVSPSLTITSFRPSRVFVTFLLDAWLNASYLWTSSFALAFGAGFYLPVILSFSFIVVPRGTTMIKIPSPGGYNKLVYTELAEDQYTESANIKLENIKEEDLVVVKTYACGVNYADVCTRWGLYKSAKNFAGWPITPGFEFSGEIESKGDNVTNFRIGQKVFGVSVFGAYSKRIRVPKQQIFPLPRNFDTNEAAGFLTVALTAWYGMFELARPRAGSWILVHSAAGGVGSMLVQLAKINSCNVVGVVGASHKVDLVKQLGCDHVIDKSKDDLWTVVEALSPKRYEVVFDANGIETLQKSYDHLAPGGRLVIYGFHTMLPKSSGNCAGTISCWKWMQIGWNCKFAPQFDPLKMANDSKSVMAFNLSFLFDRQDILEEGMPQLLSWVRRGFLTVGKVTPYPLKEVSKAHSDLESGQTVGKLVLTMDE